MERRFLGIQRLYGAAGLARLGAAHVAVIGLGGVGSWAVEALARAGVGALTLVDLDDVCVSNVNRQLHALDSTLGQPKAEVLAARVRDINPDCRVTARVEFFTEASADELLAPAFDGIVDAIDTVANKVLLIARCAARCRPVVVCGGAGGRRDPTRVRVADLAGVSHDRLLAEVRRRLRREHGFAPSPAPMGIECVFSTAPALRPEAASEGCDTNDPAASPLAVPRRLNCDWGLGSAAFVTGTFGFVAAARLVEQLCAGQR